MRLQERPATPLVRRISAFVLEFCDLWDTMHHSHGNEFHPENEIGRVEQRFFTPLPCGDLIELDFHSDAYKRMIELNASYQLQQFQARRILDKRYQFAAIPLVPDVSKFDPETCAQLSQFAPIPTNDPALDNVIQSVFQHGFRLQGQVIQKATVQRYRTLPRD